MFADDALIFILGYAYELLVRSMNTDLSRIYEWLIINKLKLNVNKTKCMFIGSNLKCLEFTNHVDNNIYMEGQKLEYVSEIKYLGFIIDQNLNFKSHITHLIKKISKKVGFLSRSTQYLSAWAKLNVYNCIIKPHFQYSNSIIFMSSNDSKRKLQKIQNRAMRIILSANKYTPIGEMLQKLGWLDVATYAEFSTMILIFKTSHNLLPKYLQYLLCSNKEVHNYNTRRKSNFRVPIAKKESTVRSVFYRGVDIYNGLPETIRRLPSLVGFKRELKNYYLALPQ